MLCTLARPSAGSARVAGVDVVCRPRAVRERIGLVFQDETLDAQLTAVENLRFHAVLYRVPRQEVAGRIEYVLDLVGLSDRRDALVSTLSGGMARRLEIARALLHTPRILFLDEPTVGLDPQTRARIWADMRGLREKNVTIFLTTHYMDEVEYADRIAIIDHGEIITCDTPAALKAAVSADTVELATADDTAALVSLRGAGYEVQSTADGLRVYVADGERAVADLVTCAGVRIRQIRMRRPTLDDVFMHFTGRTIRGVGEDNRESSRMLRAVAKRV